MQDHSNRCQRSEKMDKHPWFKIAQQEIGVEEVPGPGDNPRIVEYLESTSLGSPESENDETPWCSAFVNWCMEQAGIKGTNSAWARSWLKWGREPDMEKPDEWAGCVVILSRGANSGHVGFLDDYDSDRVRLLGGNQGDKVGYAWFPMDRVLGYRIPA
jgi:uncharacterized protein (TIGR02594 family)